MLGCAKPAKIKRRGTIQDNNGTRANISIREILQTQDTEMEIFYSLFVRTGYLLTEMEKLC